MSFVKGLRCRECGKEYPARLQAGCEECFAPLEVDYDYAAISNSLTQDRIASRPGNLWRYRELLPVEAEPLVGVASGWTPLVRADRSEEHTSELQSQSNLVCRLLLEKKKKKKKKKKIKHNKT